MLVFECVLLVIICCFVDVGVLVVVGYIGVDYVIICVVFDVGVCGFIYFYNVMILFISCEFGVVGVVLDDVVSWCGLIVDGYYVYLVSLCVVIVVKVCGKCVLVIDVMLLVGLDCFDYMFNGQIIVMKNGICQSDDGVFVGFVLDMVMGLCNFVEMVGVLLDEVLCMVSEYLVVWLGFVVMYGCIVVGQQVDMVVLDDVLFVYDSWIVGNYVVY